MYYSQCTKRNAKILVFELTDTAVIEPRKEDNTYTQLGLLQARYTRPLKEELKLLTSNDEQYAEAKIE